MFLSGSKRFHTEYWIHYLAIWIINSRNRVLEWQYRWGRWRLRKIRVWFWLWWVCRWFLVFLFWRRIFGLKWVTNFINLIQKSVFYAHLSEICSNQHATYLRLCKRESSRIIKIIVDVFTEAGTMCGKLRWKMSVLVFF